MSKRTPEQEEAWKIAKEWVRPHDSFEPLPVEDARLLSREYLAREEECARLRKELARVTYLGELKAVSEQTPEQKNKALRILDELCQDSLEQPLSHVDHPDADGEITALYRELRDYLRALQAELCACEEECKRLRLRVSLLEAHTTGLGTAGALSVDGETEQELAE